MKKIDIHIDKAILSSVILKFKEKELQADATIDLYAGDHKVSSFSIGTSHWDSSAEFDLPIQCISAAKEIQEALEPIVVSKCMSSLKQLPAPEDDLPF